MPLDPELRDELERLHLRLDRLERRAERSYTLLWLLVPVTLFSLALNIPLFVWIVIAVAGAAVIGRFAWLAFSPQNRFDRPPRD
jgi:hypothetical protein